MSLSNDERAEEARAEAAERAIVDAATDEAYTHIVRIAAERFGINWRGGPEDAGDEVSDAIRAFFLVCSRWGEAT